MNKNYFLSSITLLSILFGSFSYAETPTGASTMNTITEVMNSMAGYGVFGTDVAKERTAYYYDKIYLYGGDLITITKESDDWARNEISKVIKKRLTSLKDQGFLTVEKYDSFVKSYSGAISSENALNLGTIYKDYLRFEQLTIDTAIPLMQKELYEKYRVKIADLLKANRITQEKHDMWLVKINTQVYQYKSDPDFMAREFDEEAARYTAILTPIKSTQSATGSSQNGGNQVTLPLKLQIGVTDHAYTETKVIEGNFKKKTPVSLATQFPNGTKVHVILLDKNMKEIKMIPGVVRGGVIKISVNKSGTYLIRKR